MNRSIRPVHPSPSWALAALLLLGCETTPPDGTPVDAGADVPTADAGSVPPTDAPAVDGGADVPTAACAPLASDYTPRAAMSSTDTWAACVSDRGEYVRFDMSTSSIARTTAFERIHLDAANGRSAGLFDPSRDPAPEEFTAARMVYLEPEGLDSRLVRRTDEHHPQPSPSNDCRMAGVVAANPDYCAGPARLLPIITASFRDGQLGTTGTPPRVLAARIEASLLWFFYLSVYKESLTCATATADCDSAWAYYTGGVQRGEARHAALSRYVLALEPATHDRIWDGILAVRCWRDLDRANPAADAVLRERARDQLDRALTRGVAVVLRSRLRAIARASAAEAPAHLAFVQVIAPLLDRVARARSAADADRLGSLLAVTDPRSLDADGAVATLDRLFPCP
jgi:hypothetical protein